MIDREFPKSMPKVMVRLGAETYTFRTDAPGGYDGLIVQWKIPAANG